jgi:hypothetical protein
MTSDWRCLHVLLPGPLRTFCTNVPYSEDEDRQEDITALAICKYSNEQEVYLFACNRSWNVIGDTLHNSIDAAKEFAEDYYEANDIQGSLHN